VVREVQVLVTPGLLVSYYSTLSAPWLLLCVIALQSREDRFALDVLADESRDGREPFERNRCIGFAVDASWWWHEVVELSREASEIAATFGEVVWVHW